MWTLQLKDAMKGKRLILSAVVALAGFLPQSKAAIVPIDLGAAGSFAVLGGAAVTDTGSTVLTGDLGVYPGTSISGFYPPGIVNGTIHDTDSVAQDAQLAASSAYTTLAGESPAQNLTGEVLGTLGTVSTLGPGVYSFSSSAQLTGALTLNGNGLYVFQIGSTLTTASPTSPSTASASSIVLTGGAQACHVFWQVGSSATIGTYSSFVGTIIAEDSITMDTGADILDGRALALTGAVTLDDNKITVPTCNSVTAVPEPGTMISGALLLLPFGASTLRILRRRQAA